MKRNRLRWGMMTIGCLVLIVSAVRISVADGVERDSTTGTPGERPWMFVTAEKIDGLRSLEEVRHGIREGHAAELWKRLVAKVEEEMKQEPIAVKQQNRAFHVRFFPDGAVKFWQEKHCDIEGVAFRPNEWTDVRIRADLKGSTFDLTVDGQTAKGLPFGSPGVHRVQSIALCPNTHDCAIYIDRVKVAVMP